MFFSSIYYILYYMGTALPVFLLHDPLLKKGSKLRKFDFRATKRLVFQADLL